jgi:hypothetical protein
MLFTSFAVADHGRFADLRHHIRTLLSAFCCFKSLPVIKAPIDCYHNIVSSCQRHEIVSRTPICPSPIIPNTSIPVCEVHGSRTSHREYASAAEGFRQQRQPSCHCTHVFASNPVLKFTVGIITTRQLLPVIVHGYHKSFITQVSFRLSTT